jgi:hypothetical protein
MNINRKSGVFGRRRRNRSDAGYFHIFGQLKTDPHNFNEIIHSGRTCKGNHVHLIFVKQFFQFVFLLSRFYCLIGSRNINTRAKRL